MIKTRKLKPFPELPQTKIQEKNIKNGFSQEAIDYVLAESYLQRPDVWFAYSESIRSNRKF